MLDHIHNYGCVSTPDLSFVVLLSLLGPAVDEYVLSTLAGDGLTELRGSHGYVVQRLIDGPRSIGDMAGELGITQQAVSKSVGQLVTAGYAALSSDPADGRRRQVSLTDRGRDTVTRARAARSDLTERLARRVGAADLATAGRVATALAEELGVADDLRQRSARPPRELSV
jgi:DNA-binding MarR family transcriptional regulator